MKRRAVFLDRDGVINAAPRAGEYIRSWEEFRFLPPVADWIRLFRALDLLVLVVTNQRGIARGLLSQDELDRIHRRMSAELAEQGAPIDDLFCCPHEIGACGCRKPATGLVRQAVEKWEIDLTGSILIGDSETDRELARRCGMRFVRVLNGRITGVEDAPERA